jgi:hypothetical protein
VASSLTYLGMNAMMAEWMLFFLPISIWFAVGASAGVTMILARRRDAQMHQEKLSLAFLRARSVRTQGFSSVERFGTWK